MVLAATDNLIEPGVLSDKQADFIETIHDIKSMNNIGSLHWYWWILSPVQIASVGQYSTLLFTLILSRFKMHCRKWLIFYRNERWQGVILSWKFIKPFCMRYQPKSGHEFWFIMHYVVLFLFKSIILFNKSNNEVHKTFKSIHGIFFKISEFRIELNRHKHLLAMFIYFVTKQVTWQDLSHITCVTRFWSMVRKIKCCKQA